MNVSGNTNENKLVLNDAFVLVGTKGVPLEFILEHFKKNDWVMDWEAYVLDAMKDGAKLRTVRARVIASVGEVYGPNYVKGFEKRFDQFFGID